MILIITIEFDQTTYEVVEWLKYTSKEQVFVLNENNYVKDIMVSISNDNGCNMSLITSKNDEIYLNEISSVWIRKGHIFYEETLYPVTIEQVEKIIRNDISIINDFIYLLFCSKKTIGELNNSDINKFKVLQAALSCGLKIPDTLIVNNKKHLDDIFKKGSVITKSINYMQFETKKYVYSSYTKNIDNHILPNHFSPSFVQELINKKYELRIFFINEDYYASAIFSQSNPKTAVDFRNYDNQNPNRLVPFALPDELKGKLSYIC